MILTKEYLDEQRDCIQRNFDGYKRNSKDPVTIKRLQNIRSFIMDFSPTYSRILSVGCGGFEPGWIGADYACDVHELSGRILLEQGWAGHFCVCSCDDIPYPAKFFKVAVCSEVIEHLPAKETARAAFYELDRVADHWLVTTPARDVGEPTHKFIFTEDDLRGMTSGLKCLIERQGLFFYIHNGIQPLFD